VIFKISRKGTPKRGGIEGEERRPPKKTVAKGGKGGGRIVRKLVGGDFTRKPYSGKTIRAGETRGNTMGEGGSALEEMPLNLKCTRRSNDLMKRILKRGMIPPVGKILS